MSDGVDTDMDGYHGLTGSQIRHRQRAELAAAVAHARSHSRYYAELYRDLPDNVTDVDLLPITDKKQLMARFDDWVTDPKVTLADVMEFAADSTLVGELFAGEYTVATTSGTTGSRGIFLTDQHSVDTIGEIRARSMQAMLEADSSGPPPENARTAAILATHGHFGAYAGMLRRLKAAPEHTKNNHLNLSVLSPISELVDQLNEFRPATLFSYPTVAQLLAAEQEAGRLRIRPQLISLGGEGLPESEYERIASAFGAKVYNMYGSNECLALSTPCSFGRHHINEDWVIFEPVDSQYAPTPFGELSHTVLLSVLYRREQPILRYDLGDSVVVDPEPCECGNPFMGVRVHGRASDNLTFPGADGTPVTIVPLAVETAVENTMDVETFQIIQVEPTTLRVRLMIADGANPEAVWQSVCGDLRRLLDDRGLGHVDIERSPEVPEQSDGGKYRMLVPLPGA